MAEPGKQGGKVVLLVNGDAYFEVLESGTDGTVLLMGPTGGQARVALAELEARGYVAKTGHKLIKTDGTWLYMVAGKHGMDLYQHGKHSPAVPPGMRGVRTL